MTDFLVAIGLVFAIEGALYAAMPGTMLRLLKSLQDVNEQTLRIGGLLALAFGVLVVWIVRG